MTIRKSPVVMEFLGLVREMLIPTSVPALMSSSNPLTVISNSLEVHLRFPFIFLLLIEKELQEGFGDIPNPESGIEIKKNEFQGMCLEVLKENEYFVGSPAWLVPAESRETIVELKIPMSLATPITPKISFSSIMESPTFVLMIKLPVPPEFRGFKTPFTVNL